uniref:Uncharacterized protein n=1 Tax=viral metagenome TaxID=1070528 RepID=A0A6C0ICD7_9ZZZZ
MQLPKDDSFFLSKQWKDHVLNGYNYQAVTKPVTVAPSRGWFSKKPTPTPPAYEMKWVWAGPGAQPIKGDYYHEISRHSRVIGRQNDYENYTVDEWILVGNDPGIYPYNRALTPDEENLYKTFKEAEVEKEKQRANLKKQMQINEEKRVRNASNKETNYEVYRKCGEDAKNAFIELRNELRNKNSDIILADFVSIYSQGGKDAVNSKLNNPVSGGKRTRHKSRKSRKTRKSRK